MFNVNREEELNRLLELLRDKDPVKRWRAAKKLSDFDNDRARRALIQVLMEDPDWRVRFSAAESLGRVGGKKAIEALYEAVMEDSSWEVREIARSNLERILDEVINIGCRIDDTTISPWVWHPVPITIAVQGDGIVDLTVSFSGQGIDVKPAMMPEVHTEGEVRAEVFVRAKRRFGHYVMANLILSYKDRLGREHLEERGPIKLDLSLRPPININIPGYELKHVLGKGQSGQVCLARAVSKEKKEILVEKGFRPDDLVAIKVPRAPSLVFMSEKTKRDFMREARVWSEFNHPHIVRLIDYGLPDEEANVPYLVMELMPGGTLRRVLNHQALTWVNAAKIAIAILDALEYAHARLKAHRDIKPENVLLSDINIEDTSCVKVSDWGLAKISAFSSSVLDFKGTPDYAAPEQWLDYYRNYLKARPNDELLLKEFKRLCSVLGLEPDEVMRAEELIDRRTDIYQTGALLYEMLTGITPIKSRPPHEFKKTLKPVPPNKLNEEVPELLSHIVLKALEKNKEDRYQRADEMKRAILDVLAS